SSTRAWTMASAANAPPAATGHHGDSAGRTNVNQSASASSPASTSRPFDSIRWRRSSEARRPRQAVRRRSYSARGVEEVSGNPDVMIRRFGQLRNCDGLVRGMRRMNGSWTEQQGIAPPGEKWNVGGVWKDGGGESRDGRQTDRGHLEHVLERHAPLEGRHRAPDGGGVRDRAKHHFGFGGRRYDIRRHPAIDETDGVMRSTEDRIARELDRSQIYQRVDQLVDRRFAELRKRRMGRPPVRAQLEAEDAARGEAEPVVRRLAVDQESAAV